MHLHRRLGAAVAVAAALSTLACGPNPAPVRAPLVLDAHHPPEPEDAGPVWPRGCEAAVELALARHPGPVAAAAALEAARAETRVATTPPPEVRVQLGLPEPDDGGRVALRMPLPAPGEDLTRARLRAARVHRADAELALTRAELGAAVRRLHLAARQARVAAQRAAEAVTLAEEESAAIESRARAGVVPRLAIIDARLMRQGAEADRLQAEARLKQAQAALVRLTGHPATAPGCGPITTPTDADTPAVQVARARAAEAAADARLDQDRRGMGVEYVEIAWDAVPEDPDRLLLGFAVRLPSLSLAADPAAARHHAAQAELIAAEHAAREAAADAKVAWQTAAERLELLEADPAIAEAEALLERVSPRRARAPEVQALRRRVLRARAALDAARFDAEAAAIELRRALGRP